MHLSACRVCKLFLAGLLVFQVPKFKNVCSFSLRFLLWHCFGMICICESCIIIGLYQITILDVLTCSAVIWVCTQLMARCPNCYIPRHHPLSEIVLRPILFHWCCFASCGVLAHMAWPASVFSAGLSPRE